MFTENMIRNEAANSSAYKRGCQYYCEDRVKKVKYHAASTSFEAAVIGGHFYEVELYLDDDQHIEGYECNCEAYYKYKGACKHIIALMKAIQASGPDYYGQKVINFVRTINAPTDLNERKSFLASESLMDFYEQKLFDHPDGLEQLRQINCTLAPAYCFSIVGGTKRHSLEFRIGNERLYVMKDIPAFLQAYHSGDELIYGKNFAFEPGFTIFDEKSQALLQMLLEAYKDEKYMGNGNYYNSVPSVAFAEKKSFKLTNSRLLNFFKIMAEESFDVFINNQQIGGIRVVHGRPPFNITVNAITGGVKLSVNLDGDVYYGLDADFHYIYHKGFIYEVDERFSIAIKPLMVAFKENGKAEVLIADQHVARFFSTVLPVLEKVAMITIESSLADKYYREVPEKRIYFDRYQAGITARIEFQYQQHLINPVLKQGLGMIKNDNSRILLRSISEENEVLRVFKNYGFQSMNGSLVQEEEEASYAFLKEGLPELVRLAEIFYAEDFKNMRIQHSASISPGVRIDTGSGLLELSLKYQDIEAQEFIELLKSYQLKKKYYRMKSGSFIPLDSPEIASVAQLIDQLQVSNTEISNEQIQVPRYRALYLDHLARENGLQIERSPGFKQLVRDIREPEETEYEIPTGIKADLRNYQKTGFKWLKTLSAYGFGGILADDMGLGKTLQILALILSEKGEDTLPALVIAPTSLLYHWQDEAQKFAPDIKLTVISGNRAERLNLLKEIDSFDLVVTSYGLVKRDMAFYEDKHFKYCILDEAQNIKNPNTIGAKTVKKIKAGGYFALTGTPIENSLTELWSIFDFLMPGYLFNHNKFKNRFETSIIKNHDRKAMDDLRMHISPFVLRRMKKEVLKELPEKIENTMSSPMTAEQRKLYLAYMMKAKKEFQDEVLTHGFEKSQMKILSILTRLRQICCHPSLFIENYGGGSGKLELLMEILQEAIDGGHRILVFSQFTSMLSLIKLKLDHAAISYHYLDGATSSEERMGLVHSFNAGTKEVFLISLKAGGTGLNLTGADVVIHYDPWWNPAVEEQATDRAYRIGQKNAVQVFKLISKDSIEEKIYDLQQKKKALIDAVITPGENFLNKMGEEDIRLLFDL